MKRTKIQRLGDDEEWNDLCRRMKRIEILNLFFVFILVIGLPILFLNYHKFLFHPNCDGPILSSSMVIPSSNAESLTNNHVESNDDYQYLNRFPTSQIDHTEDTKIDPKNSEELTVIDQKLQILHGNNKKDVKTDRTNSRHHHINRNKILPRKKKKEIQQHSPVNLNLNMSIDEKVKKAHDSDLRRLQAQQTNLTCNDKTLFRIELQLDKYPKETSWELKDKNTGNLVTSKSFDIADIEDDQLIKETQIFSICLEPGPYIFTLYDSFGDGIACGDPSGCYKLYLNDGLMIGGAPFTGSTLVHSFDSSSSGCFFGSMSKFLLEIDVNQFDANITWELQSTQLNQTMKLSPDPEQNLDETPSYFTCLTPGLYTFAIIDESGSVISCEEFDLCYKVYINDALIINGGDLRGESRHEIYVSRDGIGREQHCSKLPLLAPANYVNKFIHDDNISRTLDLIYSLSSMENVQNRSSPQYRAACWIIFDDVLESKEINNFLIERYALSVFLFTTNQNIEALQVETCNFDKTKVECNSKGNIIGFDYWQIGIEGTIPSELGLLHYLERIDIGENKLKGKIPPELGRLTNLKNLYLEDNDLTGTIPSEIGNLKNLELFASSENNLEGSIPSEIGQCSLLQILWLFGNSLIGTIPTELFECTFLTHLEIGKNHLIGTLSSDILTFPELQILALEGNQINGKIPTEIGSLSSLKEINFNENELIGPIPNEIGNLASLIWLNINGNHLTNEVPNFFSNLTSLLNVDLSNNSLSGPVPDSIWDLDVETLFLSDNDLVGNVPEEFCGEKLKELEVDDSVWFENSPKVSCPCCDKGNCYVWDVLKSSTRRCPENNVFNFEYHNQYQIQDHVAGIQIMHSVNGIDDAGICLSPLGCYGIKYFVDESGKEFSYNLSFSTASKTLSQQNDCAAVDICGSIFDVNDTKREGLNHLNQLITANDINSPEKANLLDEALCWIMTQDELFFEYSVCDGTLLQRFVLVLFLTSQGLSTRFDDLATTQTCDWPGIVCDIEKNYVKELDFANQSLSGSLITEIGLLISLQKIDLSDNGFTGTIDPLFYDGLLNLKIFRIGRNNFSGELPFGLIANQNLEVFDVSHNKFSGGLSSDLMYSKKLEHFHVGKNLLEGQVPDSVFELSELKTLDLSHNSFNGHITRGIGNLSNLQILHFSENSLSGIIPVEMFKCTRIEVLMLQSNKFTGTIPSQMGLLHGATSIKLNHNILKGIIPDELESLRKLEFLHLHHNHFSGISPDINFNDTKIIDRYVADCDGSIALVCPSCSICCNDDDECHKNTNSFFPLWSFPCILAAVIPIVIAVLVFVISSIKRSSCFSCFVIDTNPLLLCDSNSIHYFIFSKNKLAWSFCLLTVIIQIAVLMIFFVASDSRHNDSDPASNIRCRSDSLNCEIPPAVGPYGWVIFYALCVLFLGHDVVTSVLQIIKAVSPPVETKMLISGMTMFGIALLTLFSLMVYNEATAETNTDLIVNAVIVLFLNDIDKKAMSIVKRICPVWTTNRFEEVNRNLLTEPNGEFGTCSVPDDMNESVHS